MNWFNRILKSNAAADDSPSPSTGFFDMEGQPVPLNTDQQGVRVAREMIHNAAVRTSAHFGIPPQWISYEVVTIADDQQAYFQLQMSLHVWDEQLWVQSGAYEQQVIKRIRDDDINVSRAVRAVLWRIMPDAGCPHDELSGAAAWRPDAVNARAAAYDSVRSQLTIASFGATLPSAMAGKLDLSLAVPSAPDGYHDTLPTLNTSGFADTHVLHTPGEPKKPTPDSA